MAQAKKRNAAVAGLDESLRTATAKKVFPIFDRRTNGKEESSATFHWKRLPFISATCFYGENLSPQIREKVAVFDLDGTIIKWPPPKIETNWEYWHRCVPKALKGVHDSEYTIVFLSNQGLKGEARLMSWKKKIGHMARALSDMGIPFFVFGATAKDGYRKPMPGMWMALERIAKEAGVTICKEKSFFVGDAAGRAKDFAGTDRKFAENLSLKFMTPEEYFLKQKPEPYSLKGNRISSVLNIDTPSVTPTSTPVIPQSPDKPEIVLFVGPPASGKTTFFHNKFRPAGYEHVNQDTLGNRNKCLRAVEECLSKGMSCVVDNTNRDQRTRVHYVDLAKKLGVRIRCFNFSASRELAWHNNLYRAYCMPLIEGDDKTARAVLPYSAFASFYADFEEPSLDEGFSEIRTVHFKFEGDEEHARYWNMWLQIDGK